MEISLKQKMIVTTIMGLIFAGSIGVKHCLHENAADPFSKAGVRREQLSGELDSETVPVGENGTEGILVNEEELIIVDVEGAVLTPGIVRLPAGSRVYQALESAGGVLENADTKYINQAEEVTDGVILYVPYAEDRLIPPRSGTSQYDSNETPNETLVNINTADAETLTGLPGIGDSYAQAIITYREQNGYFKNIDELKNVGGIGDKKFDQIKSQISVY